MSSTGKKLSAGSIRVVRFADFKRMAEYTVRGLILVALFTGLVSQVAAAKMEVGQPFPLLRLPSLDDGRPMSVADFRGSKLVLHLWASW